MVFLGYLVFIPLTFLFVTLVHFGAGYLFDLFLSLRMFWKAIILVFVLGTFFNLIGGFVGVLMSFLSKIVPKNNFTIWVVSLISVPWGLYSIYISWTMDIGYNFEVIVSALAFNIFIALLTYALISSVSYQEFE